jgi:TPR repeat protein
MMYQTGLGVEKDDKEALRWYRKAAGKGYKSAKDALKRLGK